MKIFGLVFFVAMALTVFVAPAHSPAAERAVQGKEVITTMPENQNPERLHYYFIGFLSPDGLCATRVIEARSQDEALLKSQLMCRNCKVYDMTSNFIGKLETKDLPESYKYCPVDNK